MARHYPAYAIPTQLTFILIYSLYRLSLPSFLYSLCHSLLSFPLSFILPSLLECGHDHFVEGKLRQICVPEIHVWHFTQLAGCLLDVATGCVHTFNTQSSAVIVRTDEVSYKFTRIILLRLYVMNRRRRVKPIRTTPAIKVNTVLQGYACCLLGVQAHFYFLSFPRSHT